ncbi:MAG: TraR/DksA C4-type zinc finger protein [candidate division Zixibacteria bacterium]|nr:TraR/DksA C4-type zinc finger protein [candidate division Zixibacteria bacterium]
MKKTDMGKYEKLLTEKRSRLVEDIQGLRDASKETIKDATGDLSSYSYHMADLGTDAQEREKKFLLASKSGRLIYHLDEALRRIKDGTYGHCHECGKNIPRARLDAVPHARFCISCKEAEELKKQKEHRKR